MRTEMINFNAKDGIKLDGIIYKTDKMTNKGPTTKGPAPNGKKKRRI